MVDLSHQGGLHHGLCAALLCSAAACCLQDEQAGEGGVKSAKAERDELLMALLLEQVLPRAADLYLAGPLQVSTKHTAV
jgi:hypothetical protein